MSETGLNFEPPMAMESPTAVGGSIPRNPDRIEGIDGEQWSKWLIPGGKVEYAKIKSPELKVHIRSLARRDDALTPTEKLSEFYDRLEELQAKLKNPSEKHQVLGYMDRIAERAHELAEKEASKFSGGASAALEELVKIEKRNLSYQEQQLELMRKGLKGFVQGVTVRAHVNPEQYDQNLPPWFEELSAEEQGVFRNILHINYLASIKRDTGMETTEDWAEARGLRIERDALDYMNRYLPGFRLALGTMTKDIFIPNADHLIISGVPGDKDNGYVATDGYGVVQSEALLKKYKIGLVAKIEKYLVQHYGTRFEKQYRVSNHDLASLAVSTVDSLFFSLGAYDSGDEKRKINPDRNVCSDAVRTLFQPGVKGEAKWKLRDDVDEGKSEDFGGPLGVWMRENAAADRNNFRARLRSGEVQLFPKRLFYSAVDFEKFADNAPRFAERTLAQVLVSREMVALGNGLFDFQEGVDAIPFKDLGSFELLGNYSDVRGSVIKLFKHITSEDPKDNKKRDEIINALLKIRKDPMLEKIVNEENFITACIIMRASLGKGLVLGTSEMILNVDQDLYKARLFDITDDPRMFHGMDRDSAGRIKSRLHYNDLLGRAIITRTARANR